LRGAAESLDDTRDVSERDPSQSGRIGARFGSSLGEFGSRLTHERVPSNSAMNCGSERGATGAGRNMAPGHTARGVD